MSHVREYGDPDFPSAADDEAHTFFCDERSCTEEYSGHGAFTEVWAEAKAEGWRCFRLRKIGISRGQRASYADSWRAASRPKSRTERRGSLSA